jgi:hypothetical protein
LHEGNEGRDHHAKAGAEYGGDLIAERFAAAGGHQDQGIVPGQHMVNDCLLVAPEIVVAKAGAQEVSGGYILGDHFVIVAEKRRWR